MLLTKRDLERRAEYEAAEPNQLGNLHQRMKLVVKLCQERELWEDNELWQAIFDLQTEVSFHAPVNPPLAARIRPTRNIERSDFEKDMM